MGLAGSVRENVRLRRGFRLASAPGGVVGAYLHQSVAPGLGRIAGLVAIEASAPLEGAAAEQAQVGCAAGADCGRMGKLRSGLARGVGVRASWTEAEKGKLCWGG